MKNTITILIIILSLSSFSQSNDSIDVSDTTIYIIVEKMPEFTGGEAKLFEYLSKNLRFKNCYFEGKIKTRLFVQFVIEKDGSVSNVKIIRGKSCMDNQLIKIISNMPKWKPGYSGLKKVRVKFNLPINVHPR